MFTTFFGSVVLIKLYSCLAAKTVTDRIVVFSYTQPKHLTTYWSCAVVQLLVLFTLNPAYKGTSTKGSIVLYNFVHYEIFYILRPKRLLIQTDSFSPQPICSRQKEFYSCLMQPTYNLVMFPDHFLLSRLLWKAWGSGCYL